MNNKLFIEVGDRLFGIITAAEIRVSKRDGSCYIVAKVEIDQLDTVSVVISRLDYTAYVMAKRLGREEKDEAENVLSMVGKLVTLRREEPRELEGKKYERINFFKWRNGA